MARQFVRRVSESSDLTIIVIGRSVKEWKSGWSPIDHYLPTVFSYSTELAETLPMGPDSIIGQVILSLYGLEPLAK